MKRKIIYVRKAMSIRQRLEFVKAPLLRIIEEVVAVLSFGTMEIDLGSMEADEDYIRLCFARGWQP